jgi:hypothetical protein
MYARTDVELIARHHQTERRNEAATARRSRSFTRRTGG